MNAYRVEILVIDFDEIGPDGVKDALENTRYPNRCIMPEVKCVTVRDIGEWDDDHPLNQEDPDDQAYRSIFGPPER